jgi:hypothetical protein
MTGLAACSTAPSPTADPADVSSETPAPVFVPAQQTPLTASPCSDTAEDLTLCASTSGWLKPPAGTAAATGTPRTPGVWQDQAAVLMKKLCHGISINLMFCFQDGRQFVLGPDGQLHAAIDGEWQPTIKGTMVYLGKTPPPQ